MRLAFNTYVYLRLNNWDKGRKSQTNEVNRCLVNVHDLIVFSSIIGEINNHELWGIFWELFFVQMRWVYAFSEKNNILDK